MAPALRIFAAVAGTIGALVVVGCTSLPAAPRSSSATGGAGAAGTASGGLGGKAPASGGQAGGVVAATGGAAGGTRAATGSGGAGGVGGGGRGTGGIVATGGIVGSGGVLGSGGGSPSGGAGGRGASCQVNATQCATNGLQTCGADGKWGTAVPCGPHQACGGAVDSAKCTCNVDPVCKGVGKTCASMTALANCLQDAQSCYYAASTTTCAKGTCAGAAGAAACSCTCAVGVPECTSSTSLGSCAAGPNDCNVQSVTACGAGLVCERLAPANCADPQWTEWPAPPSTAPTGYTDNGDGTVTDSNTGLMWEKTGTTTAATRAAAITYCSTMATTGGYRDWRLPSKIELLSIVDYGRVGPSIDPVFTGTAPTFYFSSTPYSGDMSLAHIVDFNNGATRNSRDTAEGFVRCVR